MQSYSGNIHDGGRAIRRAQRAGNPEDTELNFSGYRLHITNTDAWGQEAEWEVWLNTEVQRFDGLCIGTGPTREQALIDAQQTLSLAIGKLSDGDNR